jgi:Skp family chaperone for outer membrane proteins
MKLTTKIKMFAASAKSLSPAEIKDVVKDSFGRGSSEVSEAQNMMNLAFRIYQHGFIGGKKAAEETTDADIKKGQEALSNILERVAKVLEESEKDIRTLQETTEAYLASATEKTTASMKSDPEVVELLQK